MKRGFTLAEVLITLVIIGIIASMTIPSVINDQKDKEILARLKKSYSTLSQVMMLSQSFNGITMTIRAEILLKIILPLI